MDIINRLTLALIGLVLTSAGVAGLLVAAGILPVAVPAELYGDLSQEVELRPAVWAAGAVGAGLALALLGIGLVAGQLRRQYPGGLSDLTLRRSGRGHTTCKANAVADAAASDLETLPGVVASRVRLLTFGDRPRLLARLDVNDTDLTAVCDATEDVWRRLRGALGVEEVHATLRLRPTGTRASRVR